MFNKEKMTLLKKQLKKPERFNPMTLAFYLMRQIYISELVITLMMNMKHYYIEISLKI